MIKDMYNILLNKAGVNPLSWLLLAFRGGVKACCRAGFGCVDLVEKFRSLDPHVPLSQ